MISSIWAIGGRRLGARFLWMHVCRLNLCPRQVGRRVDNAEFGKAPRRGCLACIRPVPKELDFADTSDFLTLQIADWLMGPPFEPD